MPNIQRDRAKTLLSLLNRDVLGDRVDLAISAVNIFKDYPLSGAGLGMFGRLYKAPVGYENVISYQHLHVHNMYLEIAAEMGIIGLIAFAGIVVAFLIRFIKNWYNWIKNETWDNIIVVGAGASILASLISNLSTSSILVGFQDALLFWLFMSIAVSKNAE
jgi:putative inorganic carbon (HCO3(-)) transporter